MIVLNDDYQKENYHLIKNLIEDNGYKLTYQRKQILMVFIINSQKHLSVEEINNILKDKGIGISTVYRTTSLFSDLGILKEFKVDDTNYYELKMFAKKPLHIHLQCENCGEIKDVLDQEIILQFLKINSIIEKKYNVEIKDADIMFHVLSNDCLDIK